MAKSQRPLYIEAREERLDHLYGGQVIYANKRTGKELLLGAWNTRYCMAFFVYSYGCQDGRDYNERLAFKGNGLDGAGGAFILQTTSLPVPVQPTLNSCSVC